VLPAHGPRGKPPRGVLRNTPEVERGSAAPALRASDLPHRPYTAESAQSPITVIGKVRRGPLQREAGTRKGALRGPPGIGARIGGVAGAVFSHRTRPRRAAACLRCKTNPLLATETSPRPYRQCWGAGRGPAVKPLLGHIQTCWSPVGPDGASPSRRRSSQAVPTLPSVRGRKCLPAWPNNGSKAATYLPAACPLTRGPGAGGRWTDPPPG
jgi:hypothetical protein